MRDLSIQIVVAGMTLAQVSSCRRADSKIQFYRVEKETASPIAMEASSPLPAGHPDISGANSAMPATATDNSSSPLTYTTPEGWTEVPPTELRAASFKIQQNGKMVDVSVIPLGARAGSDEANINRWRGQ